MFRLLSIAPFVAYLLFVAASNAAAEPFAPPVSYPADRYQSGWDVNPFTLKTAPVSIAKESFAKDLVLGGVYGPVDQPIVSLVNKTTRERTRLRPGETDEKTGMLLKAVFVKPSRKETFAQVTMGSDTADVFYDNAFIAQMAASAPAVAPAGQPPMPGMPPGMASPMNPAATRPPMSPAGAPAANPNAARPVSAPTMTGAPPVPTNPAGMGPTGAQPTPTRRRLLTAPVAPPNNAVPR